MAELQEQQLLMKDKQITQTKRPLSVWFILILDILIFCLTLLAAREFYWTGGHDLEAVLILLEGICYLTLGIFCFKAVNKWALALQSAVSLVFSIIYTNTIVTKTVQVIQYYNAAHFESEMFRSYLKEIAFSFGPWWIANVVIFVLALLLLLKALKAKRRPKTK